MSLTSNSQQRLADEERQNSLAQCFQSLKRRISELLSPNQEADAGSLVPWFIYVFVMLGTYLLLVLLAELRGKHTYMIADGFLIASMGFGIIAQFVCVVIKQHPNFVQFEKGSNKHSTLYLMAGMYVFGVGTLFTILLRLLKYIHAYDLVVYCNLNSISQTPVVEVLQARIENGAASNNSTHAKAVVLFGGFCEIDVAFDVFRLIFTLLQLCFIQVFRTATFNRSWSVKFVLYHTMLTNGCIWIRYIVDETHLFLHDEYFSSIDEITTKAFQVEEMMTPFTLEYSLLAAGLLYTISSHMKDLQIRAGFSEPTPQPMNSLRSHDTTICSYVNLEDGSSVDSTVQSEASWHPEQYGGSGMQTGLILGTFCGLFLLVSSLMFNRKRNKFNKISRLLFLAYEGVLALGQIVFIRYTFKLLRKHNKSPHKFHFDDTLLLIGFIGTFIFHGFTIYSVAEVIANSSEDTETVIISMIHLGILIISQIQQTHLVATSSRYSLKRAEKMSACNICQCVLFLLTTNLGFWVVDSFVEMKNNASSSYPSGKYALGKAWNVMTSILYPFVVFYRFHSAEMLCEFWSRFRMDK